MYFDIGSQHLGCWGQNASRIQNKEVCATLCLQAPSRYLTCYAYIDYFYITLGFAVAKLQLVYRVTVGLFLFLVSDSHLDLGRAPVFCMALNILTYPVTLALF